MKKVLKIVGNVLVWLIFVFALIITVFALASQRSADGVPDIFGKIPVTVLSDSMDPTFKQGDLIIDNKLTSEEKNQLKVDDIVTFYADLDGNGEQELNTHRIIDVREADGYTFYTTKGDNVKTNTVADEEELLSTNIVGQYTGTKVVGLGKIMNFLQQPTGFLLCVVLPLILFFLFELYRFIVVLVSMRTKKAAAADEEEIKRRAIDEYLKQKANEEKGTDSSANDKQNTNNSAHGDNSKQD